MSAKRDRRRAAGETLGAVVIDLAAVREARRARGVLLQLLGPVPWLVAIRVEGQHTGAPKLVVTTTYRDRWVDACVPESVNSTLVEVRSIEERTRP